jgi:hypothetical protein
MPKVVGFGLGCAEIRNSKVQSDTRFRQVQAAICVMPYVLYDGLYCLDVELNRERPCPPLYNPGGRVTGMLTNTG